MYKNVYERSLRVFYPIVFLDIHLNITIDCNSWKPVNVSCSQDRYNTTACVIESLNNSWMAPCENCFCVAPSPPLLTYINIVSLNGSTSVEPWNCPSNNSQWQTRTYYYAKTGYLMLSALLERQKMPPVGCCQIFNISCWDTTGRSKRLARSFCY